MKVIDRFNDAEIRNIVSSSSSMKEVMRKLGYRGCSGGSLSFVRKRIKELGVDTKHFFVGGAHTVFDEDIFIKDSRVSQKLLRKRFFTIKYCGV